MVVFFPFSVKTEKRNPSPLLKFLPEDICEYPTLTRFGTTEIVSQNIENNSTAYTAQVSHGRADIC